MEAVLKNKSFEFHLTLLYKDTLQAIDLDDVDDITVSLRHKPTREILLERKHSLSEVTISDADAGKCVIYVNGSDTEDANSGDYEYIATVDVENVNFDSNDADFAGWNDAFKLYE
jgi:hypothetical protein